MSERRIIEHWWGSPWDGATPWGKLNIWLDPHHWGLGISLRWWRLGTTALDYRQRSVWTLIVRGGPYKVEASKYFFSEKRGD